MAPSRGKGKAALRSAGNPTSTPARASKRPGASTYTDDQVAGVYRSMLAEAEAEAPVQNERPLKKRRIGTGQTSVEAPEGEVLSTDAIVTPSPAHATVNSSSGPVSGTLQTVEDSSESENSDLEFEDVDIEQAYQSTGESVQGIEDLSIAVQPETSSSRNAVPRRKPATAIEKAHRLLVHKIHLLCLLGHCMYVNGRCNNAAAQLHLRSLLTSKIVSYLNPKQGDTQFQRNRSFMDGLQQAVDAFVADYRVTGSGLMKPLWSLSGDVPEVRETGLGPVDSLDFVLAAKDLEGSQDMGNQLFCALLRSAGVDARVVCSLQPLPFSSVPKMSTPTKPVTLRTTATPVSTTPSKSATGNVDTAMSSSKTIGKVPTARRRLGQPDLSAEASKHPPRKRAKHVPKLQYPVFWVEAFNEAQQKWIAVDAVVTHTINKPSKLEPPAAYNLAQLTYVIAFEDDGTASDVTKRYAKAYNAKTRRHRVESSQQGAKWWKAAMRFFRRRGGKLDRDQVEDAEIAQKEAREGMPGNVLDFKDHPYYALERHLKRHETIHPRREVGKVNAGTAAKPRLEPVFRRQDVYTCKSADKWYRLGREIKEGEQPLKHVASRNRREASINDADEPAATTALYAAYQTQLYMPPPVQHGRIPKNVYGNLDIYVPSMVPPGGTHINNALAQRAARILKVDFADAVTGFKFQGRHGTAVIDGAVVAEQHADAVRAVIEGIEYEIEEDACKARSLLALKVWKRFLASLRIAERVSAYGTTSTDDTEQPEDTTDEFIVDPHGLLLGEEDGVPLTTAGRFTLAELNAPSKSVRQRKRKMDSDSDDTLEDYAAFDSRRDGRNSELKHALGDHPVQDQGESGGFLIDDENGGGFFPVDGGNVDDNGGGGFVTEQNAEVSRNAGSLPGAHSGHRGGFVPEVGPSAADLLGKGSQPVDPDADGTALDDQAELRPEIAPTPLIGDGQHDATTPLFSANNNERLAASLEDPRGLAATARPASQSPSEQSQKDSLPSEDPEDEDVEPDWLESD